MRMRPCKSRPIASVNLLGEFMNSGASRISRRAMVLPVDVWNLDADRRFPRDALDQDRFRLQRQTQVLSQPSDARVLIPASGLNSNVVTTGPGLICVTRP